MEHLSHLASVAYMNWMCLIVLSDGDKKAGLSRKEFRAFHRKWPLSTPPPKTRTYYSHNQLKIDYFFIIRGRP